MKEEIKQEPTISLQRNLLGSIDLSDVTDELESEQDRKDYCAAIFAVFPRVEKKLKKMLYEQLMFSSNQADTWERVIFSRGTTNGFALLLEDFLRASKEHEERAKSKEAFDKSSPIGEL